MLQTIEQERREWERQQQQKLSSAGAGANSALPPEFARLNVFRRKPVGEGRRESPSRPACSTRTSPPPPPPPPPPPHREQQQERREQEQQQQEKKQGQSTAADPEPPPPPLPPRPGSLLESKGVGFEDSKNTTIIDTTPPTLPPRPLPPLPQQENSSSLNTAGVGETPRPRKRWSAQPELLSSRGLGDWRDQYQDAPRSGRFSFDLSSSARQPQLQRPSSSSSHLNAPLNNLNGRQASPSGPPLPPRRARQSPTRDGHDGARDDTDSGFTVTLIRRDPTSGSQWNVGTISSASADVDRSIDIEILTPGYNKFTGRNEPLDLASLGINLPLALKGQDGGSSSSRPASFSSAAGHVQNGNNGNNNNKNKNKNNVDHGPKTFRRKVQVSAPPAKHHHHRDDSRASTDLQFADGNSSSPIKSTFGFGTSSSSSFSSSPKMKSGYYTFTSPWNGTCTFVTSINGRSLKCKHTIPGPAKTNTSITNFYSNDNDNSTATVAEIRFNIPFAPGHPNHHHHSHLSPFSLSQTGIGLGTSSSSSSSNNKEQQHGHGSKRSSLALLLNPNTYHRPHSSSNPEPSTSSSSSSFTSNFPSFRPRARSRSNTRTRSHSGSSNSDDVAADENVPPPPPPTGGDNNHNHNNVEYDDDDYDDDDEERLDLSLARERAGGGLRGKSAKLGKLIVEDEGIKMLDLVVAACMGVWWRCYYHY